MSKHAKLSPSSASRWLNCSASVALCEGLPNKSSVHADRGTAAHALAEMCFKQDKDTKFFIGETILLGEAGGDTAIVVDEDMATAVQVYLDYVRRLPDTFTVLHEQQLPLTPLTGEPDASGTADTVAFDRDTLLIIDYKNGRGVEVDALDNEQMMTYAAAARAEYAMLGVFTKFKVVIVQPNCDSISEFEFTDKQLDMFEVRISLASALALSGQGVFAPAEKTCRWCPAKAICPALKKKVEDAIGQGFDNLNTVEGVDLSHSMGFTDLAEDWSRAVRAEVERRLLNGQPVEGYKVVRGRMGARQWTDEKLATEKLKNQMRYADDVIFTKKLTSPTQLEKKLAKDHPRHWGELQYLIIRKEGAPSVAPISDDRPALDVRTGFDDLNSETGGLA